VKTIRQFFHRFMPMKRLTYGKCPGKLRPSIETG
jgi:hypothetical protein